MMSMYYRDADAALICFDLASAKTFNSVQYWLLEIDKNCNRDLTSLAIGLAGNKCDIEESEK